jgi:hypothetical protein
MILLVGVNPHLWGYVLDWQTLDGEKPRLCGAGLFKINLQSSKTTTTNSTCKLSLFGF